MRTPGVRDVYVSLEDEVVLVRATLPSVEVKRMLEETGKLVVFRGHGGISQKGGMRGGRMGGMKIRVRSEDGS